MKYFQDEHMDDFMVLNYLIEHVKGIYPTSFTPELVSNEGDEDE